MQDLMITSLKDLKSAKKELQSIIEQEHQLAVIDEFPGYFSTF